MHAGRGGGGGGEFKHTDSTSLNYRPRVSGSFLLAPGLH